MTERNTRTGEKAGPGTKLTMQLGRAGHADAIAHAHAHAHSACVIRHGWIDITAWLAGIAKEALDG